MRFSDILLNCLLPLLLGTCIYKTEFAFDSNHIVQNYLPDGSWAYAFVSATLIIWNRQINIRWLLAVFSSFVLIEVFQYRHLISGVGDVMDVVVCFISGFIALFSNHFLEHKYFPRASN